MAKFTGFPPETLTFLRELGAHNNKAWFTEHRAQYESHYVEPAKAFVEALGSRLAKSAPQINAEPRINGSIFRINRDVRFSADKTPYKDHLDLWLWEGPDRKQGSSGFFFRLRADALIVGVGMHGMDKTMLARYREAVDDDTTGGVLFKLHAKLEKSGYTVGREHYARVPRGYAADHPRQTLLRHNALFAEITLSPVPSEAHSAKLVTLCAKHFKAMLPLHAWLVARTGH